LRSHFSSNMYIFSIMSREMLFIFLTICLYQILEDQSYSKSSSYQWTVCMQYSHTIFSHSVKTFLYVFYIFVSSVFFVLSFFHTCTRITFWYLHVSVHKHFPFTCFFNHFVVHLLYSVCHTKQPPSLWFHVMCQDCLFVYQFYRKACLWLQPSFFIYIPHLWQWVIQLNNTGLQSVFFTCQVEVLTRSKFSLCFHLHVL
jgi:hypothetical protein